MKVDGHYELIVKINGTDIFDNSQTTISDLSIIEQSGLILPIFELVFETMDGSLLKDLHANAELSITWKSLGWETGYTLESDFIIINPKISTNGQYGWKVSLVGIHKFHTKWIEPISKINTEAKNSFDQLKDLIKDYGKIEIKDRKKPPEDKTIWSAHGFTRAQFFKDCWLHSDLQPGYMVVSPTVKDFRLYNIDQLLLDEKPKWVCSNLEGSRQLGSYILYDPDYKVEVNTALVNSLGGQGIDQPVYDLDKGNMSKVQTEKKGKTVLTPQYNVNDKSKKSYQPVVPQSRNVHKNWNKAYTYNINQLLFMSTVKVSITFDDCIRDIHPLDLVLFMERSEFKAQHAIESTDQNSGLYIVTKVSRRLVGNRICTLVEMCRESQQLRKKPEDKNADKSK